MKAEFEVALRQDALDAEARPLLHSGLEEVDRMSGMVEDLLTLSRIDARQEELRFTDVDLAALTRATVDSLRPLAEMGGVRLTVTAPQQAVTVKGDAAHLERALRNLVKNAVEASPRGSEVAINLILGERHRRSRRRRPRARHGGSGAGRTCSSASTAPTPPAPASAAAAASACP